MNKNLYKSFNRQKIEEVMKEIAKDKALSLNRITIDFF